MGESKSIIEKMLPAKDLTFQEILNNLLEGDKNLDLKTEIFKPKHLAGLNTIRIALKDAECTISSGIIRIFTEQYLRYMVSNKRKSRTEIIKAISRNLEQVDISSGGKNVMTANLK